MGRHSWKRGARRSGGRLRLEGLEDRSVPAVLMVTTFDETGLGSLGDAIARANDEASNPGPDTIVFAPDLAGDKLSLSHGQATVAGPSAFLVSSAITIEGTGQRIERLTSSDEFRLFTVTSSGDLTLRNLTLAGGRAEGFYRMHGWAEVGALRDWRWGRDFVRMERRLG